MCNRMVPIIWVVVLGGVVYMVMKKVILLRLSIKIWTSVGRDLVCWTARELHIVQLVEYLDIMGVWCLWRCELED